MSGNSDENKIKQIVDSISRRPSASGPSPHKDVFLLALLDIFEADVNFENRFYLNDALDSAFEKEWKLCVPSTPYLKTAIELPFWYLQNDGIWCLRAKPGREEIVASFSRATRKRIMDFISYGYFSKDFFAIVSRAKSRAFLKHYVRQRFSDNTTQQENGPIMSYHNPFVAYMNSLQGTDANNLGALAEFQAQNPLFKEICIDHELRPVIHDTLLGNGREPRNVILTGHAGDGKSILALEVIRSLDSGVPFERRTEIPCNGTRIVVIKDLSEWSDSERDTLMAEWRHADSAVRFLVVSNTGPLLSMFCDRCQHVGKDRVSVENELLGAFDSEREGRFTFGPASFAVHNLARRNNIGLAMKVLEKMVSSTKWVACRCCPGAGTCPILANRDVLRKNAGLAFPRISWLYERAHAYGGRLTMRQLSAHFAFFLTGGLDCSTAQALTATAADRIRFFNLFWGDDGEKDSHGAVHQLRAVALMQEQKFNTARSPQEERLLRNPSETPLKRSDAGLAELETRLRAPVPPRPNETPEERNARESKRRRNYRRAVYFLGTPSNDREAKRAFNRFLDGFLQSPTLREALAWRNDRDLFNGNKLSTSLFRVLQEEFSGIRIAEGSSDEDRLYITLVGRMPGVRRSVQPVMASCEFRQFTITLDDEGTPILRGRGRELEKAELKLSIPFLDYVHGRRNGELGRGLTTAYRNRLEAFKAVLLEKLSNSDNDELVLLRRGADGSLKKFGVRIRDDRDGKKLEVL